MCQCVARLGGGERPRGVRLVLPVRRLRALLLDVKPRCVRRGRVQAYIRDCGLREDECLNLADCAKAFHYLVTDTITTDRPTPFGRTTIDSVVPSLSALATQLFAAHGSRGVARDTNQMARQLARESARRLPQFFGQRRIR